jgi:hypothetical protein
MSSGAFGCFSFVRNSTGVMEWWSNGVMEELFQVEIRALGFSNTPILQYSKSPRSLHQQNNVTMACIMDQTFFN